MKKTIKILILSIFFLVILSISSSVKAASAGITASKKNITTGESVNVTVTINAAAWNLKVGGAKTQSFVGNTDDGENAKKTEKISFSSNTEGTYTLSLSGDVSDGTTNATSNVSDSVTIVVSKATSSNNNSNTNKNTNTNINTNTNTNNSKNAIPSETTKEPTFKSANDTLYATGDINVRKSYATDSDIIGNLKKGESITRTGIGDNGWSKVTYDGSTGYIKTSLLTTEEPSKSSDKALKTLEITPEGLDPEFNPETTTYTLEVGADVEKLDIKAAPNDESATVEITGNDSLKPGDNVIKIVVTAQDETARTYTINVKKQESSVLGLTSIKINGYTLSPTFSSNVYEYKLNVLDPSVTKLDVTAIANVENASVEISGNNNLKDGENTVVITVTSEDGSEKVIYQIYVNKTSMATGTTKESNKTTLYIGIGIIAIIIIIIIIIIIKSKKNKKDYADEENPDDYSDLYGYSSKNSKDSIKEPQNLNNVISDDMKKDLYETNSKIGNEVRNEDNFNYNPYVSKDIYGDYDNKEDESSYKDLFGTINGVDEFNKEPSINSNVSYNDNLSETINKYNEFDKKQENVNKYKSIDTVQSYSNNLSESANIDYSGQDNDDDYTLDDNYKIRKSKGKHSK